MSADGKRIYEALEQGRRIHEEVARLLKDCDRLMAERNWKAPNTTTISGSSASINNPGSWSPHFAFRPYLNEEQPNVTKVVAVIFKDEWTESLCEPIIVGSSYQTFEEAFTSFIWWNHTWWWFKFTDANADGEVKVVTPADSDSTEFQNGIKPYKKIKLFGCPLTDVTGSETILSRVVEPLVAI